MRFRNRIFWSLVFLLEVSHVAAAGSADKRRTSDIFIAERGPNHRVVQYIDSRTNAAGELTQRTNRYTELATGLHYHDNGIWRETREEIEILPGGSGAIARHGRHKVIFAANLNTDGAIDLEASDGKRFRSHLLGIGYFDTETGQSVVLGEVQDSIGAILGNNIVIYTNAFVGLHADVRYTYRRSGFEQDVILRETPPAPDQFGLNPKTTRLEVFTEFIEAPVPEKRLRAIPKTGLVDELLDFGRLKMIQGKAFPLRKQAGRRDVLTGKSWQQIEGRTILIEEVEFPAVESDLKALPRRADNLQSPTNNLPRTALRAKVGSGRSGNERLASMLPKRTPTLVQSSPTEATMWLAKADPTSDGYVLDYVVVDTSDTDFIFAANTTYHVIDTVSLFGTTTIQGGAVIKFSSSGYIQADEVECETDVSNPAMFTSENDDDTVGEWIDGSTGSPTVEDVPAMLWISYNSTLRYLHFRWAGVGFQAGGGAVIEVWHSAFDNFQYFGASADYLKLRNVRFSYTGDYPFEAYTELDAQHVTVHDAPIAWGQEPATAVLKNCLLTDVGTYGLAGSLTTEGVAKIDSLQPCPYFRGHPSIPCGGGHGFYLATESDYRDVGVLTIDSALLADIKTMTTHHPWQTPAYAPVDTGLPDLGYHYPSGATGGWAQDSDGDGIVDAFEDVNGNGIFDSGDRSNWQAADSDSDGINDLTEYLAGDADGDGLPSSFEIKKTLTNPELVDTGSTGTIDGYKDSDSDGLTNLEEFSLGKDPLVPDVASPNFSPVGGNFASAQNVTITCPTAGATIRYTLDGSEPDLTSDTIASGSTVLVDQYFQTLKAKAWKTGWTTSDTESQSYVIGDFSNDAPTVTVSPSGNLSILASDSIEFLIEAEDAGGITKMQLYRGSYRVAESTTSPLRYNLANVPAGTYTFIAKAIDDMGAVTLATPMVITINASGPVVSLVGAQPFFTASPGQLLARITGVNPNGLSTLTLNGNAVPKRTGEFAINVSLTEGPNSFTLLANGSVSDTTTVYLDSVAPTIAITAPANNSTFDTTRVDISGTFTEASLKRITVNGIQAFISGNTFTALNVPLATGANEIKAIAEDIAGNSTSTTRNINGGTTLVDPVQLAASTVGGFATLNVTFTPTANVPGTIQQVDYDFNGDGVIETGVDVSITSSPFLDPVSHNYAAGEYFPVVTVHTTAGKFSSLGGWNAGTEQLRINVQVAPVTASTISITDPVDLQTTANGHLYVLSRSTETITQYDASHAVVRSIANIGNTPTGLDVDANGNVYVALSGDDQIAKYNPDGGTFQLDASFGTGGLIGGSGNGNGQFNTPYDVAISPDGSEISVSDSGNHRIQRFNALDGNFLGTFGSSGSGAGQFNTPKGLVYDGSGNLYIVDSGNNRVALAQAAAVIGTSGSPGTLLGQFQGAVNLGVGSRGIYVADTGNTRIQVFDPIEGGHGSVPTPFGTRLPITASQFTPALNQPSAVAQIADFLEERIYIADTGNNRVIKVTLPEASAPVAVWNSMKASLLGGNIEQAALHFSTSSADAYREAFYSMGTTELISIMSQIPTLTLVVVEGNSAQYRFDQTIEGVTITFPVEFIKENGVWKIMEY